MAIPGPSRKTYNYPQRRTVCPSLSRSLPIIHKGSLSATFASLPSRPRLRLINFRGNSPEIRVLRGTLIARRIFSRVYIRLVNVLRLSGWNVRPIRLSLNYETKWNSILRIISFFLVSSANGRFSPFYSPLIPLKYFQSSPRDYTL